MQVGGSLTGGGLADPDRAPEPPAVRFDTAHANHTPGSGALHMKHCWQE